MTAPTRLKRFSPPRSKHLDAAARRLVTVCLDSGTHARLVDYARSINCSIAGTATAIIEDHFSDARKMADAAPNMLRDENERLRGALDRIRALDEADGHELDRKHAFEAVGIARAALTTGNSHD